VEDELDRGLPAAAALEQEARRLHLAQTVFEPLLSLLVRRHAPVPLIARRERGALLHDAFGQSRRVRHLDEHPNVVLACHREHPICCSIRL
jgi:hypothetical protein